MTDPTTAREALIVEAIGDVARLLNRVDTLVTSMVEAHQAAVQAHANLAEQAIAFEHRMASLTENVKTRAMDHIARQVDEVGRISAQAQNQVMRKAARDLFTAEIELPMRRLVNALHRLVARVDRPWDRWLSHAATALLTSATTWALTTHPWAP